MPSNVFETTAHKGSGVCNSFRWKRTASHFTDSETAEKLKTALVSSWPPEEIPISIEVVGDERRGHFDLKISGHGICTQEIIAMDPEQSWCSDRIVAVILERTRHMIQGLKEDGRLR